jgi:hypothetical protein
LCQLRAIENSDIEEKSAKLQQLSSGKGGQVIEFVSECGIGMKANALEYG